MTAVEQSYEEKVAELRKIYAEAREIKRRTEQKKLMDANMKRNKAKAKRKLERKNRKANR